MTLGALPKLKTSNLNPLQLQAVAELEIRRRLRLSQTTETVIADQDDSHRAIRINPYRKYLNAPVRFGEEVLGENYTDDVVKVFNSVRDNPVTIARSGNATGKTHCAARIAVWFYKVFEDAQVYTTAAPPVQNLQRLLWGELGGMIAKHPPLFETDRCVTLHIERHAQSFITGVTIPMAGTSAQREAKFSGKHAPHLLFIIDEGDAVPDEVYNGIESCMSGGHARLLVMFNPRHEAGPVYRMERDGLGSIVELSAFRHPNVVTGEDIITGAVDREKTLRRINEWTRPLVGDEKPDNECFSVDEHCPFLIGLKGQSLGNLEYAPLAPGWRKITSPAFSYMVLGQYSALSETQLISRAWINDARSRWDSYVAANGEKPGVGVTAIMGQDVAEFGKDQNVVCFRYGGWVAPMISWGGMDPDASATKGVDLYNGRDVHLVNVDATGVGAGVAPKMGRLGCNAHSIKVASSPTFETELGEFGILRDQLWWSVREWLRTDPGAMLPPDELLLEELMVPTYETGTGRIRVMSKDMMKDLLKRSPDRADALCLTFAAPPVVETMTLAQFRAIITKN
ncbi:MAG: hypothetical protein GY743_23600 [Planctomycetaceae bacterium]|nr:hypothetical protein [Planctomycetaceae bacterium]